jgi:hypothetical protein
VVEYACKQIHAYYNFSREYSPLERSRRDGRVMSSGCYGKDCEEVRRIDVA